MRLKKERLKFKIDPKLKIKKGAKIKIKKINLKNKKLYFQKIKNKK